jgi:hypothetical protein
MWTRTPIANVPTAIAKLHIVASARLRVLVAEAASMMVIASMTVATATVRIVDSMTLSGARAAATTMR